MVRFIGLKIQGIRSVGEEPYVINFLDPLTLIQGENGTGKTTLIEALKYITTGSLPSGKMQAFIYSNIIAQKKRVDALVQLKFENVFGQECTITKRMSSNIRGEKVTTKSDDFTMSITDKDGKEHSISSKVVDFNREVLKHFGVSKAILENVIFCHQEESCWPLGEPKDLKTKFDEIFEVAKYVKAMDNFKKLRKEYENSIKIIEAELPHLQTNMFDFLKIEHEFNSCKKNKDDLTMKITNAEDKNKRLQDNLTNIRKEREIIDNNEKGLIDLNARRVMLLKQIESTSTIEVYNGKKENLLKEIEELSVYNDQINIEEVKNKIIDEIEGVEIEISKSRNLCEEIRKDKRDMDDNIKKLSDLKAEKDSIWCRYITENGISKKYEESIIECLNSLKSDLSIEYNNYKNSKKNVLKELQEDSNVNQFKLVEARNMLNQIISNKSNKECELDNTRMNLQLLQKSQEETIELTSQIKEKQKELNSIDQKDIENIDIAFKNKNSIEDTIEILNILKEFLKTQILKRKEFDSQLSEFKNFSNNILDTQFIYGKLYKSLKEKIVTCENYIKEKEKIKNEVVVLLNNFDKCSAGHEAIARKYDEESNYWKEKLEELFPDNTNISEKIVITEYEIKKLQKKIGVKEGFINVYGSWLEESKICNACPLCKNSFKSQSCMNFLEEEIKSKINSLPSELKELKKSLLENEVALENLKKADEIYKKYTNLQACEIPKMQEILEERKKERVKYVKNVESIESELEELNRELNSIKKLECQAIKLDNLYDNCKESELKVKNSVEKACVAFFPDGISSLKPEEGCEISIIEEKLSQLNDELENLKKFISFANIMNQKKNNLIGEIQILSNKHIENLESIQNITLMEEKIHDLVIDLESLNNEYKNLAIRIPKLEEKLAKNEVEIVKIEKELNQYELIMCKKFIKLDNDIESIENIENRIYKLEEVLKSISSKNLTSQFDEINKKIESFEILKSNLREKLLSFERKKDLLIKKQCQLNNLNLKDELIELEKKISTNEYNNEIKKRIIEKENKENDEIAKTAVEISSMVGELKEINNRLTKLSCTLNESKYIHVEKIFKQKLAKKVVLKKAIKDLDLCYRVLDSSILNFHEIKMEEINLTLFELWKKVYTGNDIEYIKIKSKAVNNVGDKRKSYDYAVVMVVDGNEIEMRDRCSAGQKMLASILIRIALCEVFCHQCPIIALDEPTTNLDVNKVENISEMLTDLVSYRMNGLPSKPKDDCCVEERMELEESWANSSKAAKIFSNFQLIVITHDIQLTHLLYRNFKPEYIYQLKKECDGTSKITAHRSIE
uniref:Rad50/SbcC-type AAA domain-containing protein n=2 Tax=Strongyloides stercoralis TaxID=6248 RepID=A0AAF5HZX9_STRER